MTQKSPCCQAPVRRFGGKRRQCSKCLKTWSIRPLRRGPKVRRINQANLAKVLSDGYMVKHLSRKGISKEATYKRFQKDLHKVVSLPRTLSVKEGTLILISDAKWYSFKSRRWTIYIMGLKPCNKSYAEIMDPVLKPGKESAVAWRRIIEDNIPPNVKKRIKSIVSDGIRGIENIAKENGWILQRCHFHLLSIIQKQRGKRSSTEGREIREEIYQTVKKLLTNNNPVFVSRLVKRLNILADNSKCPKRLKMTVRELIRRLDSYHSYLKHPELNIPTTTNTIESVNSKINSKTLKIKSEQSLIKWCVAVIRSHKYFKCQ